MNAATFNQLMTQVYKFNSLALAKSFAEHATKRSDIVHGDDGKFWVARWQVALKLVDAGYEYAK